jgi:hypothetical protein
MILLETAGKLAGAAGIESTHLMNIKEFCGAVWSSKELKVKRGNSACPLNAPKKFKTSYRLFEDK